MNVFLPGLHNYFLPFSTKHATPPLAKKTTRAVFLRRPRCAGALRHPSALPKAQRLASMTERKELRS